MKNILRKSIPVFVVFVLSIVAFIALSKLRKKPEKVSKPPIIQQVKTTQFSPVDEKIIIPANGSVSAADSISLISQVSGKVIYVSKNMVNGGFFRKGQILYKVDQTEYQLRVETSEADVARQEMQLKIELEEAKIAKHEWKTYKKANQNATPGTLTLREPQLRLAEANLKAAKARLNIAKLNLERTVIRAPFTGRVITRNVAFGQIISPGSNLAKIQSEELMQVVVSLKQELIAWIPIPKNRSDEKPQAQISTSLGKEKHTWPGYVARSETSLDPLTRMINLIIEIPHPYRQKNAFSLMSGMFVSVEIEGKNPGKVFKIPRYLIHDNNIWVFENKHLVFKNVKILTYINDKAIIKSGISENDKIIISDINTPIQGMKLSLENE